MEIIGRVTKDAELKTLKDKRQVVTFSIAINDYFKTKEGERKEETTYINCSYWISAAIAKVIRKGSIVSLFGRIGLNAYKGMDGEYHANLTFHANHIKLVAQAFKKTMLAEAIADSSKEDLPF